MSVADTMRAKLAAALHPTQLELVDDSHRHHGHGGWREGGESHFALTIVSPRFEGMSRVARQRLVYQVLAEELAGPVHALQLVTLSPVEAQPR
ncbi:MAG: BolA family protein [Alphaproteobacteria bacterium]|nr:BolA family protein [Alphaproteobacteria bacterium]